MTGTRLITRDLLAATLDRARASARRRINHNFHAADTDNPHRFLNAMLRGTYVQPHRHADPPKSETFLVLEGEVAVITFDDTGAIASTARLGSGGTLGIDIDPGIWHTVIVLSDTAVCFEVKPGPWSSRTDKEFAPWAPAEGSADAAAYLEARTRTLA